MFRIALIIAFLIIFDVLQSNSFKNKRYPEKKLEHKVAPKVKLNCDGLPNIQEILDQLGLSKYYKDIIKMGVTETRLFLRLSSMDFRMMEIEWTDFTSDMSQKLKAKQAELLILAIVHEEPASPLLGERNELNYGRIYIQNAVQSFEYSMASFGGPPPVGKIPIVMENSLYGCDPNVNESNTYMNKAVIVMRGNCTFLEKALNAKLWNATTLIITNNEDRLESPSSGYGVDRNITERVVLSVGNLSILSLSNTSLTKLTHTIKFENEIASTSTSNLSNATTFIDIVPLKCRAGGMCKPILEEEKQLLSEVTSGTIRVTAMDRSDNHRIDTQSFEFLTSNFGSTIPTTTSLQLVMAHPIDLCKMPNPDEWQSIVEQLHDSMKGTEEIKLLPKNIGLVSVRGNCRFDMKAYHAQLLGARLLIVIEVNDEPLQRLGGMQPDAGYVGIPSILVTSVAGKHIMKYITADDNNSTNVILTAELSPSMDTKLSDMWIELAITAWEDSEKDRIVQLEGLIQKYKSGNSIEIIQWLNRSIAEINHHTLTNVPTDETISVELEILPTD